jgi:hypothetical protein
VTRRRRIIRWLAAGGVSLAIFLAAWTFWYEPRRLVVREHALALPCWTAAPLRVAVASDLHIGAPGVGLDKLDAVIDRINAARPDVVLLLGDFVIQGVAGGRFVPPETTASHLKNLRAPLGIFAVLGNHDWWLDAPRVARAFQANGIVLLEDTATRVRSNGDAFWLAGVSDFWEGAHDVRRALSGIADDRPVLAMTHNPDIFPQVPPRVCLTLAGHTHGGQVAFPFLGAPIVPSRFGERFASGLVVENGRHLFVTVGVGTSIIPVRFRVPPEIVVLTLSRE